MENEGLGDEGSAHAGMVDEGVAKRPRAGDWPAGVDEAGMRTAPQRPPSGYEETADSPDPRAIGFFLGLLAGEGHFGGDGTQPQVTLRMHVRHEALFRWLERTFPGGRLYGPYHHGGRSYFQWMARGRYLRDVVAPLVARNLDLVDAPTRTRFLEMSAQYGIALPPVAPGP